MRFFGDMVEMRGRWEKKGERTDTPKGDFKMADAFFLGAMMEFAYEEGLDEKRKRKIDQEALEPDDILDLKKKDKDF